jgi:hypothetical protein
MRDTWSRQYTLINDINAAINAFWLDHRPLGREPAQSKSIHQASGLTTGSARRRRAQLIDVTGENADRRTYSGAGPPIIPRGEKSILKNAMS